jgi:DNA invertase Pin-like site-specific DNA recombinase
MTIAAYIRVSTEQQRDEGSHENQRERIEQWAEREGYEDVDYYEDIAISGRDDDRPEFNELMDSFEDYEAVVVRELSRFGRSPEKNVQQIIEIADAGVDFISIKEEIDTTTANGRLVLRMFSAINGWFAEQRSEQATAAARRRKERGLPVGRPTKLNDSQMEDVHEWREMGHSYAAIAALVGEVHGVDISRETIRRYCKEGEES